MSLFPTFSRSTKARCAAVLLALGVPLGNAYAQRQDEPRREVSDRVSEQLAKLRELTDNKDYQGAIRLIDDLLRRAEANSYDVAILSQIRAQVLLTENRYAEAIQPLEQALRLGETYGYFDAKQMNDLNHYLAQLYYQEATTTKEAEKQRPWLDKAIGYLRKYLQGQENNPDAQLFAAHLFYNRATLDEKNVDMPMLQEAKKHAEQGLHTAIKPKETFYVLLLAALQMEGRSTEVSELLELLVKNYPTNRQYWQQLAFTYLALAEEHRENPELSREYNIRTILAIERAQELGVMDTPRDHFNLLGIYFNIQQFDRAIELLEKGLQNGNVENTQKNWELLASSYQQVRKELKAIDVLKEAARQFPEAGQLEFTIAQTYYTLDKMPEAYRHAVAALEKGNLEKRSAILLFAAYVAYELQKYQEGLKFAEEAAKDPTADGADRLVRAISDAIQERDLTTKAK